LVRAAEPEDSRSRSVCETSAPQFFGELMFEIMKAAIANDEVIETIFQILFR
jgi:hypothetical protein